MVPPLQTALVVTAELTSMTARCRRGLGRREAVVGESLRRSVRVFCESEVSTAAETCGASLVPVMVTWTVSVSVSLLLSVMVTV